MRWECDIQREWPDQHGQPLLEFVRSRSWLLGFNPGRSSSRKSTKTILKLIRLSYDEVQEQRSGVDYQLLTYS